MKILKKKINMDEWMNFIYSLQFNNKRMGVVNKQKKRRLN